MKKALVTGGSGYFGSLLIEKLLRTGYQVGCLDINKPCEFTSNVKFHNCNILDQEKLFKILSNYDYVFHNVAQVPLAKDNILFHDVNVQVTKNICKAALHNNCEKLIYTSSSAVFGVPKKNPVNEDTIPKPGEAYGAAKLKGEEICRSFSDRGLSVSIIRPRTIIGHGRLGIFSILFDWISDGVNIPVLNGGNNIYQFVHADDLADACILSSQINSSYEVYNIGADDLKTMRETLEELCDYSKSGSRVYSLPMKPIEFFMNVFSFLRIIPLGPYHSLMYGKSLYFDISKAKNELNFKPKYDTSKMFFESYDWYLKNKDNIENSGKSHHKSITKESALKIVRIISKLT